MENEMETTINRVYIGGTYRGLYRVLRWTKLRDTPQI